MTDEDYQRLGQQMAKSMAQVPGYLDTVRKRLLMNETFEVWWEEFQRDTVPFLQLGPVFAFFEARGINNEKLYRALYNETRRLVTS